MENTQTRNTKLKICIVDDSDHSRINAGKILENAGFNIVGLASSAEEALQITGTSEVNLYLIDVVMPDASGIELAKVISDKNSRASIIMMSSLKMENIILESISSGAIDFLSKPFDADELIKSVEKIELELSRDI